VQPARLLLEVAVGETTVSISVSEYDCTGDGCVRCELASQANSIPPDHLIVKSDRVVPANSLDGEFLGSVALFTVDRTLSRPPHLFNGIEVRVIGRPMKSGAGDCNADSIEWFLRLLCSMA
jgi:hypothetical protein